MLLKATKRQHETIKYPLMPVTSREGTKCFRQIIEAVRFSEHNEQLSFSLHIKTRNRFPVLFHTLRNEKKKKPRVTAASVYLPPMLICSAEKETNSLAVVTKAPTPRTSRKPLKLQNVQDRCAILRNETKIIRCR